MNQGQVKVKVKLRVYRRFGRQKCWVQSVLTCLRRSEVSFGPEAVLQLHARVKPIVGEVLDRGVAGSWHFRRCRISTSSHCSTD